MGDIAKKTKLFTLYIVTGLDPFSSLVSLVV